MIQVSAQYGDQRASKFLRPFHKQLNDLLGRIMLDTYCKNITKFSIVLRVSGTIWKFEGEGPEKLKFMSKKNEMTIDLVIPQSQWESQNNLEFKLYIANGIRQCFDIFLQRAKAEKELLDKEGVLREFNNTIKIFLNGTGK